MTQFKEKDKIHNISRKVFEIMKENNKIKEEEILKIVKKEFRNLTKKDSIYFSSNVVIKINALYFRNKKEILDYKEIEYIIKQNIEKLIKKTV